jgi:integrase
VLGLEVGDVNFDRKTVTFRPNRWRRLKTGTSHGTAPPGPTGGDSPGLPKRPGAGRGEGAPGRALLFPGFLGAGERCLGDFRKALGQVCARAGWKPGEITTKVFRHAYCTARLQTTDRGQDVGAFTVGRELGHGGVALVHRVNGHLGEIRHRSEVVEYRVEAFEEMLRARLADLRSDTTSDTTPVSSPAEAC